MKTIKRGTQSRQLVGEIHQKEFCICICVRETQVLKGDCFYVFVSLNNAIEDLCICITA